MITQLVVLLCLGVVGGIAGMVKGQKWGKVLLLVSMSLVVLMAGLFWVAAGSAVDRP